MNYQSCLKKQSTIFDEASFTNIKAKFSKEDYIIVEACTNAFWFQEQVKDLVKKCFIPDINKYTDEG